MIKINKFLTNIIFFIIMSFILIVIFLFKDYEYIHFMAKYNYKALILSFIIFIFINKITSYLLKLEVFKKNIFKFIFMFSLIIFFIQILLIKSYYFTGGQDMTMVLNNSYSLAYNNIIQDKWYFETYPNNILITFLYSKLFKVISYFGVATHSHYILIIILCFLSFASSLLIYKITCKVLNNYFGVLSWIYYNLLIGLSGWLSIVYTDTLALSFPLIILYSYLKMKDSNYKPFYFIIFITLSTISVNIKPQSFIIFLAIILYEVFILKDNYKIKIKTLTLILLSFSFSIIVINKATGNLTNNLNKESNIGYLHYIKMGLNEKSWGVFDYYDFKESTDIKIKRDRDEYNKLVIKERLKNYNLKSYLNHLIRKTLLNFNNGTFGWYWMATYPEKNIISKENFITTYMKNIYYSEGYYYKRFNFLQQSNWLIILIFTLLGVFSFKNNYKYIFLITIIGLFLFVSIFEASARYLFTNVPIFIICAMYGLQNIIEIKNKIFIKTKN